MAAGDLLQMRMLPKSHCLGHLRALDPCDQPPHLGTCWVLCVAFLGLCYTEKDFDYKYYPLLVCLVSFLKNYRVNHKH